MISIESELSSNHLTRGKDMDSNEILIPALRQYMHNDGSGLVAGYDIEETDKAVGDLIEVIKVLRQTVMEVRGAQRRGPGWYTKGAKGLYMQVSLHLDMADKAIKSVEPFLDTSNHTD